METLSNEVAHFVQASANLRSLLRRHLEGGKDLDTRTTGSFLITQLKSINERAQLAKDEFVSQTEEARSSLSGKQRDHQSTEYRVAQLLKQAENERIFRTRPISLVPRATFDQCAPQRLREQATLSKHNQQLARLEFELEQRKELATKLKQKKAQVERLRIELADRRDAVIDVEPGLVALVESTKPLLQGLELELSTMGESIHFDEEPSSFQDPMVAIFRQCKMREQNCQDIITRIEGDQIVIALKSNREIAFVYCSLVDRIFTKSNFNLDGINGNDVGTTGRPNMFGEVEEPGEIGKKMASWIQQGWKCYRWVQNVAGYELMLPDEELQNVADLDSAIDSILLL